MLNLLCTWKGKSDWLVERSWYVVLRENTSCYFVRREGFPDGKMYSKKHFLGVPVVEPPEVIPDVPDYLSEFDV